ncbi:hypothetical protein Bca52824_027260 [Brassica carinata]|uniref:Uncharacterized protein n=1 Tax=Brassica carinata TaxID=52824 RepID=A0A8X7SJW7_BRACI|nr:hypothetical protein Bca52824_027260 [Brassica carinata]
MALFKFFGVGVQLLPDLGANFGNPQPNRPTPPLLAYKGGKGRRCFKEAILRQTKVINFIEKDFGEMFPRWEFDAGLAADNIIKVMFNSNPKWKWTMDCWEVNQMNEVIAAETLSGLKCLDRSTSRGSVRWRKTTAKPRKRVTLKERLLQRNGTGRSSAWLGMSKRGGQKNSAEVERNSLSDQIALLEEMLHKGDQFDIRAEKTRLKAELRRAKEDVKAIKVPFVDWEKLGEGWFWSQP